MEETCPKCKAKRIGKSEYCVCGHKWEDPDDFLDYIKQIIKESENGN